MFLASAFLLFAIAGKLILFNHLMHGKMSAANQQAVSAQSAINQEAMLEKAVFANIPVGSEQLQAIGTVVVLGCAALYTLAQETQIRVSTLSIMPVTQADVAITAVATSLPQTNGGIKRVMVLLKVNFNDIEYLYEFLQKIPDLGGSLSNIKIKAGSAAITVQFIGV